jgi:protein-S-isoprenylcysteine O-methyltransferase Ste14
MSRSSVEEMAAGARLFVWAGGGVFVASLAVCTWWYLAPLGDSRPFTGVSAIVADTLIFSAFALHHSIFARDGAKRALAHVVPDPLLRSAYVWIASVLLIIVCVLWRPIGGTLYRVEGAPAIATIAVQLLGVYLIARSVAGLDPLELAGIHGQAQNGGLQITGPYRLVRHPLYLGWALALFGHPHMTGDRLAFALISTIYLILAIPLEEAALVASFGDAYRRYQTRVPWRMLPYVF